MLALGHGVLEASCAHTPGTEAVFDVTVPDGSYDLIVSTDVPATGTTDTVIHVRAICSDLSTDIGSACNDDREAGNARSLFILHGVEAGTYTVFVEPFGHPPEEDVPFGIEFGLRPLLGTGTSCDPTGRRNRCSTGACATESPICP
jgi:hypothetical protein